MEDLEPVSHNPKNYFQRCAQCGAEIIAASWSEWAGERCVRNVWSCDACGYEFETATYFPAMSGLEIVTELSAA